MTDRIESWVEQMTLAEKVALLAGASAWYTVPIERLGIPAIKVTDGPNGARGEGAIGSSPVTSACFPVGIALAATWNPGLITRVGEALGEEVKYKSAHILLAPTVNIHRSPLGGRNFECFSEDPYLTTRMAVAYITGVQSQNVGATIKHFVCNDSEFERMSISSDVGERALREIYLPPFKAAVQEADVWAVMSSYNRVNGTYASDNNRLLNDILKEEWGFKGIVMSDWGGTYSTVPAANGGLDLEMPGPTKWRGDKLIEAVEAGDVTIETIDDHVRRMLTTIIRSGAVESPGFAPERAVDKPEHRIVARAAATEAIVLLKNEDGILPLDKNALSSVAIIGPNAKAARIMGGGSSQVAPHYAISPYEGVLGKLGGNVRIDYERGCSNDKMLNLVDKEALHPAADSDAPGLQAQYFDNNAFRGDPVRTATITATQQSWYGENPLKSDDFSAIYTGTFTPPVSGTYGFSFVSNGPTRMTFDGNVLFDHWDDQPATSALFGPDSSRAMVELELNAKQAYPVRIELASDENAWPYGFRWGWLKPGDDPSIERAAQIAAGADVALVFAGLNGDWESEGHDRLDMELAGDQVALIEAVAAANPNTVVVLNTGSPIRMPWLGRVKAVLEAWFGGQETGNAIADVLFGDANPSGRLPETFPVRMEDNPAFLNYPGENGHVLYGEGLFVGYRYYEKKKIEPLFPFGFGLSYTTFAYRNLRLSSDTIAPDDTLTVSIDVTNTGSRAGHEVVQLYVRDVESSLVRPPKELKAFAKIDLDPGETKTVILSLDRDSLAYYDDRLAQWIAEAGTFEVLVGSSSVDIHASAAFTLSATAAFGGPGEP